MTKEEIKDFLDISSEKDIINFIFQTVSERNKYKKAVEELRIMLNNSVSKDRYNSLVKKYNKLLEGKN